MLRMDAITQETKPKPVVDITQLTYATVNEFAGHHGVCTKTVWRWIERGMPSYRNGRVVRIFVKDATAWVHGGGASKKRR